MGMWESKRGHVSDEMAAILGDAFKKIGALKGNLADLTMFDLMAAITYVSGRIVPIPPGSVVELGDDFPNILGEAFGRILGLPSKPSMIDLADAIEFVSRGSLVVEISDHKTTPPAFAVRLHEAADTLDILPVANIGNECCFKTIPNRGQIQLHKR